MKGADVLYRINLEAVKNSYLKSDLVFTTGKGTKVHVGAATAFGPERGKVSFDKEKAFLALTTDRDGTSFVRAMGVLNWSFFYRGSGSVTIDGEAYELKVHVDIIKPEKSSLVVKGPLGTVLEATLRQIGESVARKSLDVRLSKLYKLACGNEVAQCGGAAKLTSKVFVLMMPFPPVSGSHPFVFNVLDIPSSGCSFPAFEDRFGFCLNDGALEIYPMRG